MIKIKEEYISTNIEEFIGISVILVELKVNKKGHRGIRDDYFKALNYGGDSYNRIWNTKIWWKDGCNMKRRLCSSFYVKKALSSW